MSDEMDVEDVKPNLATAVGYIALSGATVQEAATEAGITRWELEECLERTGLVDPLGIDLHGDVTEEIDRLLEERT